MFFRGPRQSRSIARPARAGVWLALFAVVFLNIAHGLHGPWMPGMGFVPAPASHTAHTAPAADHAKHANHAQPDPAHHHHAVGDDDATSVDVAEPPPHPKHQMPPMCPLCQAMHAMGGILPVSVFVLVRHVERPAVLPPVTHKPRIVLTATASARGPPGSA